MKKNTKKFEKDMREIIKKVIKKQSLAYFFKENPEPLCECIDRGYIGGITYDRALAGNAVFVTSCPFARYQGIEFLENRHPKFRSNAQLFLSISSTIVSVLALMVAFLSNYIDIHNVLDQFLFH